MPSRKRNKGQARKAKAIIKAKEVQKSATVAEDEPKEMIVLKSWFTRRLEDVTLCSHSCPPLPAAHVGNTLIDAIVNQSYTAYMESSHKKTGETLNLAFDEIKSKHPEIWSDPSIRELVRKSFLGRSVDIVLQHDDEGRLMAAGMLATASLLLESSSANKLLPVKSQLKIADVLEGDKKSLIGFFSKRLNCICVDKMSKDFKSVQKTGLCQYCYERFDRGKLLVCSRCKTQQYCSTGCQKEDWPKHKEDCYKV